MKTSIDFLNDYEMLLDRLNWVDNFVNHLLNISNRTGDLYFRATQAPRNIIWKDNHINELLDICDSSRKTNDEFVGILDREYVLESKLLVQSINDSILRIKSETEVDSVSLNETLNSLKSKKEAYKKVWFEGNNDPWIAEFELKSIFARHLRLKNTIQINFDLKRFTFQQEYNKSVRRYEHLIKKLFNLMKNYHFTILNAFRVDLESEKSQNLVFYDASDTITENEDLKKFDYAAEYEKLIDSIKETVDKSVEIKKDILVTNFGLCKLKISGTFRLCFFVFTQTKFLHFFRMDDLTKTFQDYKGLIQKLNAIPHTLFSTFVSRTDEKLGVDDECRLKNLNKEIYDRLDGYKLIADESVFLFDKKTKIDRSKNELIIYLNENTGLFGFLQTKKTVVKGFTTSDLYEILASLDQINEESTNTIDSSNIVQPTDKKEEKKPLEFLGLNFQEVNPW